MKFGRNVLLVGGMLAVLSVGCSSSDKPESYADQRPDPSGLTEGDTGLQSKDVLEASDQMAHDLLTSRRLNESRTQWTLAVGHFEDETRDREFDTNYDIFLERLRSELSEKGDGRITLIENKDEFHAIRDSELDSPTGGPTAAPQAIQPDYILTGKALDLPNRSTDFYELEFTIFNTQTRQQVWSRDYEVKAAR